MSKNSSYRQILKASSIMGGVAGITLLLAMLRTKIAAVLIGATGVGLNVSFTAVQNLVATLAGLGLQSSAVREIALAVAKDDQEAIGRLVFTVRRLCWFTGLAGMVTMILLSPLISQLTFGHRNYTLDIAALGLVVLFTNISGGQMALIQGVRRIGDMARVNIFGAGLGTVSAIALYATLGLRGIVPTLVTVAAIQLAVSWFFARQVEVPHAVLSWRQTFMEANGMVRLGLVIMTGGLLTSAVSYITVTLITQHEGVQAVGLYSAAYALSGLFANFVLGAMGADYYPRLTAVASEEAEVRLIVNEQTEIGLLLSLPGLVATIFMAPLLVKIFYTQEFSSAVQLMQWFILGCLGQVISWPLGYLVMAHGKGRWFLFTEVSKNLIHVALIYIGLRHFNIEGVAIAFFILNVVYTYIVYKVSGHLIKFRWSDSCKRIILLTMSILAISFISNRTMPIWLVFIIGPALTLIVSIWCIRELANRVGSDHSIILAISRIPGAKWLLMLR